MQQRTRLQDGDFSLDAEVAALRALSARVGGVATFLGCARDFSQGREVSEIHFEAYERMALAEMEKLCDEAGERFGLIGARIVHRVGRVQAGDNIVLIATAAQHRAPALEACHWLIDELKARVPIWKKEITPSGDFWVSERP